MNTSSEFKIEPPSIIQALLAGFNTIANKPNLILIPIILDFFLWFGPAWRVDGIFLPLVKRLTDLPVGEGGEAIALLESYQATLVDVLANFNLALSLRTLPVGVPSLMVSKPSFLNPLGRPLTFSLDSNIEFITFWLFFILAGFILGSLYLQNISKQIIQIQDNSLQTFIKSFLQIILMPVLILILLLLLTLPLVLLITLVTLISPAISQFILIMAAGFIIWAILPLIFTPHGIFLYKQNLMAAMITSIKVVRFSMSKTAWFILFSYLMVEAMNYLWRSPNVDNWFLTIGILGHAFIVSAVVAASFHYFIEATKFSQSVINQSIRST